MKPKLSLKRQLSSLSDAKGRSGSDFIDGVDNDARNGLMLSLGKSFHVNELQVVKLKDFAVRSLDVPSFWGRIELTYRLIIRCWVVVKSINIKV